MFGWFKKSDFIFNEVLNIKQNYLSKNDFMEVINVIYSSESCQAPKGLIKILNF